MIRFRFFFTLIQDMRHHDKRIAKRFQDFNSNKITFLL
jgi:hypothetical protein